MGQRQPQVVGQNNRHRCEWIYEKQGKARKENGGEKKKKMKEKNEKRREKGF